MHSGRLSLVGTPELGAAHARCSAVVSDRTRSRFIDRIDGLRLHVLAREPGRPRGVVS